jgi:putative alpha-1,2-mannosidase
MVLNISRIGLIIALVINAIYSCHPARYESYQTNKEQFVDHVYPMLDAANSRWFYFSSACRPFGMVNLSPDMVVKGTWGAGYRYNEDTIRCLSHVHAWQLSGIPVLPVTGQCKGPLGPDHYGSRYTHDNERVHPGYHEIFLESYGINVELTSTTRVGFHRLGPSYGWSHYRVPFNLGVIIHLNIPVFGIGGS